MVGVLFGIFGTHISINNNKSTYFVIITKISLIVLYGQYTPTLSGVNTNTYIILLFIGYYYTTACNILAND